MDLGELEAILVYLESFRTAGIHTKSLFQHASPNKSRQWLRSKVQTQVTVITAHSRRFFSILFSSLPHDPPMSASPGANLTRDCFLEYMY